MKRFVIVLIAIVLMIPFLAACQKNEKVDDGKYKVVVTTTMLTDMVKEIGRDKVNVNGLMGLGIDPHLYKASAGDVSLMQNADMIVYNGMHLEGKMGEIFENLTSKGKQIVNVSSQLDKTKFLATDGAEGTKDPHIWFDVMLWRDAVEVVTNELKTMDSENAKYYDENGKKYMEKLEELDAYVRERAKELTNEQRVLITAHDAFNYFGAAYDFKVKGLQGISTASEAGTGDVKELADFIAENEIKAVFIESSVPVKNIEALKEAVKSRGFEVEIGGELFSDSLGDKESEADTYIGTVKHNIDTIVEALK